MGRLWKTIGGKRVRTKAGVAHEYAAFQSSAKAKAERASRNSARRSAIRAGKVHKGDGKDIDHIRSLASGGSNAKSNLRVVSKEFNRSRRQGPRKRGSRRNKSKWGL